MIRIKSSLLEAPTQTANNLSQIERTCLRRKYAWFSFITMVLTAMTLTECVVFEIVSLF